MGDADLQSLLAHRNIVNSAVPKEPSQPAEPPEDVRHLYAGPFLAFQESRHFASLDRATEGASARRVTATRAQSTLGQSAQAQCAQCHGPRSIAPKRSARRLRTRPRPPRVPRLLKEAKS